MTQAGRLRRVLAAAAIVVSACSRSEPPKPAAPQSSPQDSSTGIVKGRVPLPTPGATIVVVLEPKDERSFPPQSDTPVMDQVGLTHMSLSVSDLAAVLAMVEEFGGSVVEETVTEQFAIIRDPDGPLIELLPDSWLANLPPRP